MAVPLLNNIGLFSAETSPSLHKEKNYTTLMY